jgi:hypothetical protein
VQFAGMNQFARCCFLFSCCIYLNASPLLAQIENADALPKQFDVMGESSMYWVPNLLQSGYSGLHEMAQYHGFALNWTPRGLLSSKGNQINGIDWSTKLNGWDPSFSYAGLYRGFKIIDLNPPYGMNAFGISGASGNSFMSSNASLFTKTKSISSSVSNATTMQELRLQWHSGLLKNSYAINVEGVLQKTPLGFLANGIKDRQGFLLSVEKIISAKQQMGFSFWWSPVMQGKRAPTVQELYTLTKDPLYNPSWGWLDGKPFYANTKKSNAPVLSLHYDIRTKKENLIQLNLGVVLGRQSSTQLDWSRAADPRPDYYKYLPSYAIDEQLKNKLLNWYTIHPELFQIQFDQLKAKNLANANGSAQYIINEQVQQLQLIRFSALSNYVLTPTTKWHFGLSINSDKIEYSNQVADLLGGKFYYNYNTWVNDDGFANAFQNDLQFPDRKIKLGESWGAQYALTHQNISTWTSLTGATALLEWGLGMQLGFDQMQREGLKQNGLYPNLSKGLSAAALFPSYQYQFFLRYKFNGRWYLTTRLFQEWEAPDASELYADPANHAIQNPFLLPLIHLGTEIKLQFMGSNIKANVVFFAQSNQNERQYKLFYHDYFNAFVRASVGQMETMHYGMESYIETNWTSPVQFSIGNSYGWYTITNQPLYEIRIADNLYKVQSGKLLLKNFPATSYPQSVQAFTINYQPVYSLRISYTTVYANRRAISHDVFRRSDWVQTNSPTNAVWDDLYKPVWASSQWVSNLFISKNMQVETKNKKMNLRLTSSIRNLFNTSIPSLIFEQSRYDYKNFNTSKFPAKYIYDLGRTYTIGLQLSML